MDREMLVAPCGVYCGICPVYIADKAQDTNLRKKIAQKFGVKIQDVSCDGCRSGHVFLGDEDCSVKSCVTSKGLYGCFRCDDFPCRNIRERPQIIQQVILRSVPILKASSIERFVELETEHYRCPQCGTSLFMGARKCPRCGRLVDLNAG
jgi:hypothetical protein